MQLIKALRATSSPSEKQRILATSRSVPFIKELLRATYDPYKHFGVKFHSTQIDSNNLGDPNKDMFALLDRVYEKHISGNAARKAIEIFAMQNGDLIKTVCNKDLDCGIATTIINKAFLYDLIPSFKVQLAKEANLDKVTFPVMAQLKYNGTRCIAILKNGTVTLKTRNGHSFRFVELEEKLGRWHSYGDSNIILDGELTFGDSQNEDHTKISGFVNSARHGTSIPSGLGIRYNVFDTMSYEEFTNSFCNTVYSLRWQQVLSVVESLHSTMVVKAKSWMVRSKEELDPIYKELIKDGYEGLILKNLHHFYTFKRTSEWAKMKATLTADLMCMGCIAGDGKYEDAIGALLCEGFLEDTDKRVFVSVKVGSGLSDEDRFMPNSTYEGKVIEIKYNKMISSGPHTHSLFLPRFVCVREDK